jgi:general secretion pathway protein H
MQTSGRGNDLTHTKGAKPLSAPSDRKRPKVIELAHKGFTLLELLVVLLIMALGASLATLSLAPSSKQHLNEEATRLIAQLESTKAQARASSLSVSLGLNANGFYFAGLSPNPLVQTAFTWLYPQTQAHIEVGPVLLGPEALTAPSSIVLTDALDQHQALTIASDGLRPFQVILR